MIVATAVFMVLGLVWDLWKICWIVYPIAGFGCGIVSMLFSAKKEKDKENQ